MTFAGSDGCMLGIGWAGAGHNTDARCECEPPLSLLHTCTHTPKPHNPLNSTGKLQEKREGAVAWLTEEQMAQVAAVLAERGTEWVVRDVESKVRVCKQHMLWRVSCVYAYHALIDVHNDTPPRPRVLTSHQLRSPSFLPPHTT